MSCCIYTQYNNSKKDILSDKRILRRHEIARDILSDKNQSDLNKTFANALYASFDFEQDAMIHSIYSELMSDHNNANLCLALLNSDEYEFIYDMQYVLDNMDKYPEALFGISKTKYAALIQKQLDRFKTKIGKVLMKCKKDKALPAAMSCYSKDALRDIFNV